MLKVQGMSCGGCVKSVEKVLRAIDGVKNVQVSLENANVNIDYDTGKTDTVAFKSAIVDAGFEIID